MMVTPYWDTLKSKVKEQILRIANREAFSGGPTKRDTGNPGLSYVDGQTTRSGRREMVITRSGLLELRRRLRVEQNHRNRVQTAFGLQTGAVSYPDVQRCRKCMKLFLVPKSRPGKLGHYDCGRNFRQSKFKKAKRERELERVRPHWRKFGHLPDGKVRIARKARVTPNFIAYAIRRGEL
jgi:hypothetical protein